MIDEIEIVRNTLHAITGAPYEADEVREDRLLLKKRAAWFVWCGDFAFIEEDGPLKAAWKDREGNIWLESSEIADMIALVERDYGENGVATMPDIKPEIPPTGEIPEEVLGYPRVVKLLRAYEDIVTRFSKKHGIELKMLYDGGVGVTTVRIGARIGSPSTDGETLRQQIIAMAKVLKEARERVLEAKPPE